MLYALYMSPLFQNAYGRKCHGSSSPGKDRCLARSPVHAAHALATLEEFAPPPYSFFLGSTKSVVIWALDPASSTGFLPDRRPMEPGRWEPLLWLICGDRYNMGDMAGLRCWSGWRRWRSWQNLLGNIYKWCRPPSPVLCSRGDCSSNECPLFLVPLFAPIKQSIAE